MADLLLLSMSRRRPLGLTLVELRDADRATLAAHPIGVGGFAGRGTVTIELDAGSLLVGAPDLWQLGRTLQCLSCSGHQQQQRACANDSNSFCSFASIVLSPPAHHEAPLVRV